MRATLALCGALAGAVSMVDCAAAIGRTIGNAAAASGAEGAEHYGEGRYEQALAAYRDAQLEDPESALLHFNIGDALYKTGDLEGALSRFQEASGKEAGRLKANSLYNMGNVYFQQGQYPQAAEAFREALEYDGKDGEARANLELALKRLEDQQQQQPQQGEDGESGEGQEEDAKSPSPEDAPPEESPQQDDAEQKEEQEADEDRESADDQDRGDAEQTSGLEEGPSESEPQSEQAEGEAMARREAEQLLDAFKDREREAQRLRYRGRQLSQEKDW